MKDKIKKRLGLFVIFFLGLGILHQGYKDFQIKAADSEAKAVLSAYYTAQKSFVETYGTYGDDPRKLGLGAFNGEYEIYFKSEDVPEKYKNLLSIIGMPYIQKDTIK